MTLSHNRVGRLNTAEVTAIQGRAVRPNPKPPTSYFTLWHPSGHLDNVLAFPGL